MSSELLKTNNAIRGIKSKMSDALEGNCTTQEMATVICMHLDSIHSLVSNLEEKYSDLASIHDSDLERLRHIQKWVRGIK